jgi:putative MFS transporter
LTVLLNGFFGIGTMLSAAIGIWLVPFVHWRIPLLFTCLGVLSIPLDLLFLPESLRFLLSKGRLDQAEKISQQLSAGKQILSSSSHPLTRKEKRPVSAIGNGNRNDSIWSPDFRLRTAVLWWVWFALNFTFQGVFIWLPSILMNEGNSLAGSSLLTLVISIGYIPGTILGAYFADFTSRRLSLALFMIAWGISAFFFGFSHSIAATLIWGFLVAMGNGASWGMAYPVTTELYPTRMRATATGWASGFGRIGGILAPYVVGLLIQVGSGNPVIFTLLGAVPAGSTLVLLGLNQQTTGRTLEEIT